MAADHAQTQIDRVCMEFDITRGQYNVLRILRGAGKEGHPRYEIAARMVEKAPDVTRLIDRLEKEGLVVRERAADDKRYSITRISQKGLRLLDKVEPKLDEARRIMSKKLSLPEWIALSDLCEKVYDEQN
ncbi:MAG: MarR family transcriptional regulator [Pyrinomonadaceae bacterium]